MLGTPSGHVLVGCTALQFVPGDTPNQRVELPIALEGDPLAAALLGGTRLVLGDGRGQLHLVDLQRGWAMRVDMPGMAQLGLASCMAYCAPCAGEERGGGALFLGTSSGAQSMFVHLPAVALEGDAEEAVAGWEPAESPGLQSLAPIFAAAMVPDPAGSGDAVLLMCCGTEPCGRLALARPAARLASLGAVELQVRAAKGLGGCRVCS